MGSMARTAAAAGTLAFFYAVLTVGARLLSPASQVLSQSDQVRTAVEPFRAGRYADALAPTLALSNTFPSSHVYAEQLAVIYHHLDRPKDEAEAWERFIRTSPSPFEACPQIVDAYRRQGLIPAAVDASNRCLAFAPDDPDMMFAAGHAAEWSGNNERSRELYQRALAIDDRNMDVRIGLARVQLHAGDAAGALNSSQAVLAVQPDDTDALFVAGMALLRLGRLAEARGRLERALTLTDKDPDLHLALGMVEEDYHHADVARRHYERALALDPSRSDVRGRLTRLDAAPR